MLTTRVRSLVAAVALGLSSSVALPTQALAQGWDYSVFDWGWGWDWAYYGWYDPCYSNLYAYSYIDQEIYTWQYANVYRWQVVEWNSCWLYVTRFDVSWFDYTGQEYPLPPSGPLLDVVENARTDPDANDPPVHGTQDVSVEDTFSEITRIADRLAGYVLRGSPTLHEVMQEAGITWEEDLIVVTPAEWSEYFEDVHPDLEVEQVRVSGGEAIYISDLPDDVIAGPAGASPCVGVLVTWEDASGRRHVYAVHFSLPNDEQDTLDKLGAILPADRSSVTAVIVGGYSRTHGANDQDENYEQGARVVDELQDYGLTITHATQWATIFVDSDGRLITLDESSSRSGNYGGSTDLNNLKTHYPNTVPAASNYSGGSYDPYDPCDPTDYWSSCYGEDTGWW